jgi:hypothetical protein
MTRAQREAAGLPKDFLPTQKEYLALLERLHNTQLALKQCRDRNARLRRKMRTTEPTND